MNIESIKRENKKTAKNYTREKNTRGKRKHTEDIRKRLSNHTLHTSLHYFTLTRNENKVYIPEAH